MIDHTETGTGMTRAQHMAWAKQRAIELIDAGDLNGAFTSFASDVAKHPETKSHGEFIAMVGMPQLMAGMLNTPAKMREWINGFN